MDTFRKQLELINLKKKITNTPKKRDRIVELLGKEDGWLELSKEWMEDYDVLCGLKNMSISELNYLSNDFMEMRYRLYEATKQRMINARECGPAIILNSPQKKIQMYFKPLAPLRIVTTKQHRYSEYVVQPAGIHLACPLINHDSGSPIYIFGDFIMFQCGGQELTECYLLNNPRLEGIWLTGNRLTTIPIGSINPKLAVVILADNPLDEGYIPGFISQLPYVDRKKNPDEVHVISFSGIPGNWKALAERRGWRVLGSNK